MVRTNLSHFCVGGRLDERLGNKVTCQQKRDLTGAGASSAFGGSAGVAAASVAGVGSVGLTSSTGAAVVATASVADITIKEKWKLKQVDGEKTKRNNKEMKASTNGEVLKTRERRGRSAL